MSSALTLLQALDTRTLIKRAEPKFGGSPSY
jgi:hypothetical protein